MRYLITGGTVFDGTGAPGRKADVLLHGGKIEAMGDIERPDDAVIVPAQGYAVTPGFVDIHRHCDIAALRDPAFGESERRQGISTVCGGNCGLAAFPARPESMETMFSYIRPVVGPIPANCHFSSHSAYVQALRKTPLPVNMGFFVGLGAVKTAVKGFASSPFTPEETDAAVALVEEGLRSGAQGVTIGLMYQPECYSSKEELVRLIRPAAKYGGVLCTHIRGEGDSLAESVREVIAIAAEAGVPLNISHLKATGIKNWGKAIFGAFEAIEQARATGQDVSADFYPYTCGSTTLQSLLPPTVLEDEPARALARMGAPEGWRTLKAELAKYHPGWDNMAASIGWERITISAVQLPKHLSWQGKNIAQLAEEHGVAPEKIVADLLFEENGMVGIIVQSMAQRDVDDIARKPYTALISDALYSGTDHPHPRLNGAFPHFLREYVLERHVLPFETAIHKMTQLPMQRIGLHDRGVLEPGAAADVNVFDPYAFADGADYNHPMELSRGMRYMWINGELVCRDNRWQALRAGCFLAAEENRGRKR